MTTPFQNAKAAAFAALNANAAVTVTYVRGADTVDLESVKGRGEAESEGDEGFTVRQELVDWLFDAADLVLGGQPVKPQQGDLIKWTTGGETRVYLVGETGAQSPWKYSDQGETRLRVHTTFHGTE